MSDDKSTVENTILTELLELDNYRKTPERYAVFDAVCGMKRPFTIDQLEAAINEGNVMRLCRATLYNTLNLLLKLKLVVKQKFKGQTVYALTLPGSSHCWIVCTECGNVNEVVLPEVVRMLENIKVKGFKKEGFELYLHGKCSKCRNKKTTAKRKGITAANRKENTVENHRENAERRKIKSEKSN